MATCARTRLRDSRMTVNAKRPGRVSWIRLWPIWMLLLLVAQAGSAEDWVLPRTEYGHPDLQGNWTNGTLTPMQRPEGFDAVLTPAQVAEMEGTREELIETAALPSDPDRKAPPEGRADWRCTNRCRQRWDRWIQFFLP